MKILVATDGSKPALHAVKYAVTLLRQMSPGSHSITLMSVHDDVGLRHAKSLVGRTAVADYLRELSEKELKPQVQRRLPRGRVNSPQRACSFRAPNRTRLPRLQKCLSRCRVPR